MRSIGSSTARGKKSTAKDKAKLKEEDAAADEESCFLEMGLPTRLAEVLASKRAAEDYPLDRHTVMKINKALMSAKRDETAAREDARIARQEADFLKPALDVSRAAVHTITHQAQRQQQEMEAYLGSVRCHALLDRAEYDMQYGNANDPQARADAVLERTRRWARWLQEKPEAVAAWLTPIRQDWQPADIPGEVAALYERLRNSSEILEPGGHPDVSAQEASAFADRTISKAAQFASADPTRAGESVDSAFQQLTADQQEQSVQSREIDGLTELRMTQEQWHEVLMIVTNRAMLDKEEDSMLSSTTGNMRRGRAAKMQQRTKLWARWVEAHPDKAAATAKSHGWTTQELPRRVADFYEDLRDHPALEHIVKWAQNNHSD